MDASRLAAIANRVKTPIALAALALILLYLVLRQVLGLDLFSRVSADETSRLLKLIIDSLFWLCMVAVILGVFAFILPIMLPARLKSNVRIV
jgi:hypothetical protein